MTKCLFLETDECNTVCRPLALNGKFDTDSCYDCIYNDCKYCINNAGDDCIGKRYERVRNEV